MDKLKDIFDHQQGLDASILANTKNYNPTVNEHVKNKMLALLDEVGELNHELKPLWGYWKKNQTLDNNRAREEAIDCLHFLVSIMQDLGMNYSDVYNMYIGKNKENHKRQDNNY